MVLFEQIIYIIYLLQTDDFLKKMAIITSNETANVAKSTKK